MPFYGCTLNNRSADLFVDAMKAFVRAVFLNYLDLLEDDILPLQPFSRTRREQSPPVTILYKRSDGRGATSRSSEPRRTLEPVSLTQS